jgi:hypothetical protein
MVIMLCGRCKYMHDPQEQPRKVPDALLHHSINARASSFQRAEANNISKRKEAIRRANHWFYARAASERTPGYISSTARFGGEDGGTCAIPWLHSVSRPDNRERCFRLHLENPVRADMASSEIFAAVTCYILNEVAFR